MIHGQTEAWEKTVEKCKYATHHFLSTLQYMYIMLQYMYAMYTYIHVGAEKLRIWMSGYSGFLIYYTAFFSSNYADII